MLALRVFTALVAFSSSVAAANCYFPDGSIDTGTVACNPSDADNGGVSMCCRDGDTCTSNGTCQAASPTFGMGSPPKVSYRPSCTDQDWNNSTCPSVCRDSTPANFTWITPPLCEMTDGSPCCFTDSTNPNMTECSCNFSGGGPWGPGGFGGWNTGSTSATSTITVTSSTPAAESSAPPIESDNTSEPERSSLNSTQIVGLAVGLSLGGVLIIAAIVFFLYYRRHQHRKLQALQQSTQTPEIRDERGSPIYHEMEGKRRSVTDVELAAGETPELPPKSISAHEMEGGTEPRYEMDATDKVQKPFGGTNKGKGR